MLPPPDSEVRAALESAYVTYPHGGRVSLWTLLVAWEGAVDRIDRERGLTEEPPHGSWTPHDLVGALCHRERIARGLRGLDGAAAREAHRLVGLVDDRFRSFTAEDADGVFRLFADDEATGAWWWSRIPVDGPVAADLAAFRTRLREEREG